MPTTTQPINVGLAPNDKTGDPIRTGGQIINENTLKLFNLSNKIDETKVQVFKYAGNTDITQIEVNDVIQGIVVDTVTEPNVTIFIFAQYNGTESPNDFGTLAGNFNDGGYNTFKFTIL